MNYKKIYKNLIRTRKPLQRSKKEGLFHRHHIVPKALGGSNKKENIILLTPKEHFVAHRLLAKCYKNNPDKRFRMMCALKRFICFDFSLTPRQYEIIQREHAAAASQLQKNKIFTDEQKAKISQSLKEFYKNHNGFFFGKKHSKQSLKLMSEKQRGQLNHGYGKPRPQHIKEKISKTLTGVKKSPEHAAKIRARKLTQKEKNRISESITKWHAHRKMAGSVH
jgi:hypothetical protein